MDKEEFIKKLQELTKLNESDCAKINEIIDNHLIIGRKGKEKIISDIVEKLSISSEEANKIYNTCMDILVKGIKDKLKHPFKSLD